MTNLRLPWANIFTKNTFFYFSFIFFNSGTRKKKLFVLSFKTLESKIEIMYPCKRSHCKA